jgi:bacterial/archaeal transporter family protein
MQDYRWLQFAILAAVCAAAINIFGKIGMSGIDADLSTAIRSVVQAAFVVGFVTVLGTWHKIKDLSNRPLAICMIICSGVAGGLSWIFAFRALKLAHVSQVAPIDKLSMPLGILLAVIILGDRPSLTNWIGILMIAGGAYLATWKTSKPDPVGFPVIMPATAPAQPTSQPTLNP